MKMHFEEMAEMFKALGDQTRLGIVELLQGKELCVCDIIDAFTMSQPAISHHLRILKQAGIVDDERVGKWIYYRLQPKAIELMGAYLQQVNGTCSVVTREIPSSPHCKTDETSFVSFYKKE